MINREHPVRSSSGKLLPHSRHVDSGVPPSSTGFCANSFEFTHGRFPLAAIRPSFGEILLGVTLPQVGR